MIRTRIVVLMATSSIALTGVSAAPASAGKSSHWSQAKCVKTFNKWYSKRVDLHKPRSQKLQKQTNAYIKVLRKHHGCVFGG
ncbi:MAG TPA: hypothetical protein VLJ42_07985 [Solirubrobacteraceae bacterium]|nr:hypothetical protein [Solirubrobacteraceae bacterium]